MYANKQLLIERIGP